MLLFDAATDTCSISTNMNHHRDTLTDEIHQALADWLDAVASRNVTNVIACYAQGGRLLQSTLLPTVAAGLHNAPEHFTRYFTEFLSNEGLRGALDTNKVVPLGPGYAAISGRYTFRFIGKDGEAKSVPAEYTFIFREVENKWLIIHHHSSSMNRPFEVLKSIYQQMTDHYRYHLVNTLKGVEPMRAAGEEVHVQLLDDDHAYVCGINLMMQESGGIRHELPTRFSLLYSRERTGWRNIHAHMSPVPGVPFAQAA